MKRIPNALKPITFFIPVLLLLGLLLGMVVWNSTNVGMCATEALKSGKRTTDDLPQGGLPKAETTLTSMSFILRKDDHTVRVEPRGGGDRIGVRVDDGKWQEWSVPHGGTIERMDVCRWVPHRSKQIGFAVGLQVVQRKEKSYEFYVAVFIVDYTTTPHPVLASILPEDGISDPPFHRVKRTSVSPQVRLAGVSNPIGDSVEMVILSADSDGRVRADVYLNSCPIASLENTIFSLSTERMRKEQLFRRVRNEKETAK